MAKTATKEKLSPTQERVITALNATKGDVPKAAKRLRITPNGVYGHLRRIEEKGHDVSQYRSRKPRASTNGSRPRYGSKTAVDRHVKAAIAAGEKRITEISSEIVAHDNAVAEHVNARKTLTQDHENVSKKVADLGKLLSG